MKSIRVLSILLLFIFPKLVIAQEDLQDITYGKHRILHSDILDQDRMLYVYLPEGYEESDETYTVLFQLYGHFKENYYLPAIRTTSLMGGLGKAPNSIVVGVMNREFRYRDLLPVDHWGGKSEIEKFVQFFREELIPFIENNYRVNNYRVLSGPQAGAAFGVYTFAKHPGMFSAWILSSPFWITDSRAPLIEITEQAIAKNDYTGKFLMVAYGRQETESELKIIMEFNELLSQVKNPGFRYYLISIRQILGSRLR